MQPVMITLDAKASGFISRGRDEPLTNEDGELKTFGKLQKILGQNWIRDSGFDVDPIEKHAVVLNKAEEELPSASDIAKAYDIELQEIVRDTSRRIENLNQQLEGSEDLPMWELLGLDKQLRSIRGLLEVEVAKRVQLEECIKKEKHRLTKFQEFMMINCKKKSPSKSTSWMMNLMSDKRV